MFHFNCYYYLHIYAIMIEIKKKLILKCKMSILWIQVDFLIISKANWNMSRLVTIQHCIGILIMLALNNINYKASINGILIMLALKYKNAIVFLPTY